MDITTTPGTPARSATSAGSRGRPTDPHLQGRLIEAAVELLAIKGYTALTMVAVAKGVGASTASLYRRWPTKKALVADLARTVTLDSVSNIDTGSLQGDLRELIDRKQRLFQRVGHALLALLAESGHDPNVRSSVDAQFPSGTPRATAGSTCAAAQHGNLWKDVRLATRHFGLRKVKTSP